MNWDFGVSGWKLLCLEWINNKILVYSTGNYIQPPGIKYNQKECMYMYNRDYQVALEVKNLPANARDIKDKSLISGSGRSPGGGSGTHSSILAWRIPRQRNLANPMYKGAWQGTVHRVTGSQTWLKQFSTCACMLVSKGVTLLYSGDWHNIINQLCINLKNKLVVVQLLVISNSLQPHGLQHARLSCPSPSPRVW